MRYIAKVSTQRPFKFQIEIFKEFAEDSKVCFFRMQINVFIVSLDPEQFALRIIHSTHPCFVELPDLSKVMALLPQPKRHNREGVKSSISIMIN